MSRGFIAPVATGASKPSCLTGLPMPPNGIITCPARHGPGCVGNYRMIGFALVSSNLWRVSSKGWVAWIPNITDVAPGRRTPFLGGRVQRERPPPTYPCATRSRSTSSRSRKRSVESDVNPLSVHCEPVGPAERHQLPNQIANSNVSMHCCYRLRTSHRH
jgi:hypothetical protein